MVIKIAKNEASFDNSDKKPVRNHNALTCFSVISCFTFFSGKPLMVDSGFSSTSSFTMGIGATLFVGFAVPFTAAVGLGIPLLLNRHDSFMADLLSSFASALEES